MNRRRFLMALAGVPLASAAAMKAARPVRRYGMSPLEYAYEEMERKASESLNRWAARIKAGGPRGKVIRWRY